MNQIGHKLYIILIVGGSGITNGLSHLLSHHPYIDKICLYDKD